MYPSVLSCPLSHWSFRKQLVSHILNLVLRSQGSFWSLCSWGSHAHQVFRGYLASQPPALRPGHWDRERRNMGKDRYEWVCVCVSRSVVSDPFVTLWTVDRQAPLSMGFSRQQEYWNGLPFPSPGDLPKPGIEPISLMSLALQEDLLSEAPG